MIIQQIDKFLRERNKDIRNTKVFHVSSIHKKPKELYYEYLNINKPGYDTRIMRVFDNGKDVHKRIQGYLRGIITNVEKKVQNKEYGIEGHIDGICKGKIIEIKSINKKQFYNLTEPLLDHLIQINMYMFCTKIKRGIILYECKDNQELEEFQVKKNEKIIEEILKKIKYVQEHIKMKQAPIM